MEDLVAWLRPRGLLGAVQLGTELSRYLGYSWHETAASLAEEWLEAETPRLPASIMRNIMEDVIQLSSDAGLGIARVFARKLDPDFTAQSY